MKNINKWLENIIYAYEDFELFWLIISSTISFTFKKFEKFEIVHRDQMFGTHRYFEYREKSILIKNRHVGFIVRLRENSSDIWSFINFLFVSNPLLPV